MIDFTLITTDQWIVYGILAIPVCFCIYISVLMIFMVGVTIFGFFNSVWNIISTIIGWFSPTWKEDRQRRKDDRRWANICRSEQHRCQLCGALDYGPRNPCKCYRKRV